MEKNKLLKITKKNWLLISILLLAAFFRLYRISGYMEFLGDQGRDALIVRDFLKNGNLFFIGPQTSIGNMYLPPFYYYLIAPALLLSGFSPLGPAVFVALLGVATVFLVYRAGRLFFGEEAGFIASFLYAVSPQVIKYSNFSWNPNIMPFFALLAVFSVYKIWREAETAWLLPLFVSLIFCLNSHYLALLLLPFSAFFLFLAYRRNRNRKNFSARFRKQSFRGFFLFLLSFLPLVLFDIKNKGQNFSAICKFFTVRQTTVNLKAYKAIPNIWPIFTQIITDLLGAKLVLPGLLFSVFLLVATVLVLLKRRKKAKASFLLLVSWLLVALLGLGLYKQHIYTHYFGLVFPAPFLLLAYFVALLPIRNKKIYHSALVAVTIVLSLPSLKNSHLLYPPNNQLQRARAVAGLITGQSRGRPFNLALLAHSDYDDTYEYFLTENLYGIHEKLADQLFVICEPHPEVDCNPYGNPLWEIAAFGWAKEAGTWQVGDITVTRLIHDH